MYWLSYVALGKLDSESRDSKGGNKEKTTKQPRWSLLNLKVTHLPAEVGCGFGIATSENSM
jgi:hypothetical protein